MAISKIGSKALVDCSVAAVDIEDGSITSAKLAGSIANAKLANSSITVNGTSVSLGASGSIPAVTWQSVKTNADSPVTLVAGNGYFMNTTSGTITANLPASASAGDTIAIKDYAGTFATNNLTIGRNGHNIQGVANDSLISTNRASLSLVYVDSTKGWLYAVESNVQNFTKFVAATGGTVTTSGDFKIHSFTGDSTFVVSCGGGVGGSNTVEYLVVAGGGGGASGGGGGAGGFRFATPTLNPETFPAKPLNGPAGLAVSAQTYPVTVGGAGAAAPNICGTNHGSPGSNSVFSTITSAGGGGGAGRSTPGCSLSGGSGGGAASACAGDASGGAGNTPPVSPPQGNNGGNNSSSPNPTNFYGGGGGAIAAGAKGGTIGNEGGAGGVGAGVPNGFGTSGQNCGSFYYFSGGGGGGKNGCGCQGAGDGGLGGGGNGQLNGGPLANPPSSGTTNTGGGGGGGGQVNSPNGGQGAGGSGIVIIRYKFQ